VQGAAAQDVPKDVTQDEAEGVSGAAKDVLGAAEDESVKLFIFSIAIFQRRNPRPIYVCPWATREGRVRGVAQGVAED